MSEQQQKDLIDFASDVQEIVNGLKFKYYSDKFSRISESGDVEKIYVR